MTAASADGPSSYHVRQTLVQLESFSIDPSTAPRAAEAKHRAIKHLRPALAALEALEAAARIETIAPRRP